MNLDHSEAFIERDIRNHEGNEATKGVPQAIELKVPVGRNESENKVREKEDRVVFKHLLLGQEIQQDDVTENKERLQVSSYESVPEDRNHQGREFHKDDDIVREVPENDRNEGLKLKKRHEGIL